MRTGKLAYEWRDFWYGLATLVTGAGVGWFLGLGLETLAPTVFGPVLTLISGTATVLAGVGVATESGNGTTRANPIMVMLLVIGLVGGSILSSSLRANLALAPDGKIVSGKTHLTEKEINQRVFDKLYPLTPATSTANSPIPSQSTTPVPAEVIDLQCSWRTLNDADLMALVKTMKNPVLQKASPAFIRDKIRQKCGG
jgi:hypothetical protein